MKYQQLLGDVPLTLESYEKTLAQQPTLYLHVHSLQKQRATDIISVQPSPRWIYRAKVELVVDDELNENEWYLAAAIGSNPP